MKQYDTVWLFACLVNANVNWKPMLIFQIMKFLKKSKGFTRMLNLWHMPNLYFYYPSFRT
jgi:hypothetical protein